ncbi:membrane or secreted protein [Sediminibacterium goheungense]|uniref:Membrane or secreted protein n=1 Tax=Sediminibacterium goheungense TaxID=1086393 RepID=A0A4R6J1P5_9BACT|nr:membrane or secreted protein [Sediminibacterium goheungense]TDO29180.1 hypothetical protein BC659_1263 [Sediminibacterium goheungense]
MKKMIHFCYYGLASLICCVLLLSFNSKKDNSMEIQGAWRYTNGKEQTTIIITPYIFSSATYNLEEKKFISSYGGNWSINGNQLTLKTEWNSLDSTKVGTDWLSTVGVSKNELSLTGLPKKLARLDNGTPGALVGAWIITGSYNNDQVSKRRSPFYPRRTMKVLSGKHFQWIAYNVATKQFIDTGGGTYTTENGKYTETIHFFTKTAASVGKTLTFDYSFVNGDWRHKGEKSTGGVLDECWTKREVLEPKQ